LWDCPCKKRLRFPGSGKKSGADYADDGDNGKVAPVAQTKMEDKVNKTKNLGR
jgi:hypothetical protein